MQVSLLEQAKEGKMKQSTDKLRKVWAEGYSNGIKDERKKIINVIEELKKENLCQFIDTQKFILEELLKRIK